jgi:hypothetical protein
MLSCEWAIKACSEGVVPRESPTPKMLPVNAALLAVGVADLLTTVFWLATGRAVEANPMMAAVLRVGIGAFVTTKLVTLVAYVGVMEWYRRRRCAVFARVVGSITLIAYIGIYAISFACVNWQVLL